MRWKRVCPIIIIIVVGRVPWLFRAFCFLVLFALHSSRDIIERFPSTYIRLVVAETSPLSPLRHTRSRRPGLTHSYVDPHLSAMRPYRVTSGDVALASGGFTGREGSTGFGPYSGSVFKYFFVFHQNYLKPYKQKSIAISDVIPQK